MRIVELRLRRRRRDSELEFLQWVDEEVECCWCLDENMQPEGDVEETEHGLVTGRLQLTVEGLAKDLPATLF